MNQQALLFQVKEQRPKFDGQTYEARLDGPRLKKQLDRVREYMLATFPTWLSLAEISKALEQKYNAKFPSQSVSARLRDLKKKKFGSYEVPKKRRTISVWEYLVYPKDGLV